METEKPKEGRLRPPLHWYGGKWMYAPRIVAMTPEHRCFVEVFCGSCAVTLAKPPSPVEVLNDLDGEVCNFFRVLRDRRKRSRLVELLEMTPYAREELRRCLEAMKSRNSDTYRAWAFCVACNFARNGKAIRPSDWSFTKTDSRRGMSRNTSVWCRLPEVVRLSGERLKESQIENAPWEDVLRRFDSPSTHFYCDPPYMPGVRVQKQAYKLEMTEEDHERFLAAVLGVKGTVAISGYASELYDGMLSEWNRVEISAKSFAGPRDGRRLANRTEVVWMNYGEDRWATM